MTKSTFNYVAYIRTTPEKLWNALTTQAIIKQFWFGMNIECDWQVGSTWKMYSDSGIMDSGEVLEVIPQKRLVIKWKNEWKPEFKVEGDTCCEYLIEQIGACAKLSIKHSIEQPNSKFIEAVSEGWPMVVSNLKSLLETGQIVLVDHPNQRK